MKNKTYLIIISLLLILQINAKKEITNIFTTLVVIEEKENGDFVKLETPVSDGIFEALWDKEDFIFFDIAIEKPLKLYKKQLDIRPFMDLARETGADSILLIKLDYDLEIDGASLKFQLDKYDYNLYSLNDLTSLRVGSKEMVISKVIESKNKIFSLKNIGIDILNNIYN